MLSAAGTEVLAGCVLVAMGVGLLAAAVWRYRRNRFTVMQALIMAYNLIMVRVVWRTRIHGRLPLGPNQGAVIVCNHRCPVDPSFIALLTDRIVHWMVAKEFCVRPSLAWFFRACQSIPVNRGGIDTAATKLAIRHVREGRLVGVFPEGRINLTDQLLLPGRPGAALIAMKADAPIIPCYVKDAPHDGTTFGCLFMAAKVDLFVGRPIDTSEYHGRKNDRQAQEELTRRLLAEIARLAGCPDFEPKLAGRFYKRER